MEDLLDIKKKVEKRNKAYLDDEWVNLSTAFGNTWAMWYFFIGARMRGKSYFIMNSFLKQYFKHKKKRPFYWIRLTENEQKILLNNNAIKLLDPPLKRKWIDGQGYELLTNAERVYIVKRDDKRKIISRDLLCTVLSLSGAGNQKGTGYFDQDYIKDPDAWYNICLDEFNRSGGQKKTFDIVTNLGIQIENLIRSTKDRVRICCVANNVGSCSELLAQFNFIPSKFGVFKLRKRKVVLYNVPNNKKYIDKREGSALETLVGKEDSGITNEVKIDVSLVIPNKQRLITPKYIIKFLRDQKAWFTVYDNGIISCYNKESSKVVAMRRYIDEKYDPELVNNVIDLADKQCYLFKNMYSMIKFQDYMSGLKRQA